MKKILCTLALFPFLHATSYPVELVSCAPQEIVVSYQSVSFQVTLFNTTIDTEKGWNKTCSILKDAKKLRIEIDPSSKIDGENIPVYLFADTTLVQEELIKKSVAIPLIHNPEYTYEKRLEKAMGTTKVMAQPTSKISKHKHAIIAPLYLLVSSVLWVCMLVYFWISHKRNTNRVKIKK